MRLTTLIITVPEYIHASQVMMELEFFLFIYGIDVTFNTCNYNLLYIRYVCVIGAMYIIFAVQSAFYP